MTRIGADSALSTGLAGMQLSQQRLVGAASDMAQAGAGLAGNGLAGTNLNPALTATAAANGGEPQQMVDALLEMRRQEQIFTASAKVVSVADGTLGSLIDVIS